MGAEVIEFKREMFPFHLADKDALGAYLGVTGKTVRKYLKEGLAPYSDELANKMRRLQALDIFPLDDSPKGEKDANVKFSAVIGRATYCAYKALLAGDEEVAEAISSKALNANSPAWEPEQDPKKERLRVFFLQMVNAIAWSRNPHTPESPLGLPALSKLRRRVEAYLARRGPEQKLESMSSARRRLSQLTATENEGRTWAAWQFLRATCAAYWLCDLLGEAGEVKGDKALRQVKAFQFCEEHARLFLFHRHDYSPRTNIAAMNAWNLLQLAAISDNHYELFHACVKGLQARYRDDDDFDIIAKILRDDSDTHRFMLRFEGGATR
jgi:hypothetical protein